MSGSTHPLLVGVVPIIPTPFTEDEAIDHAGVAACVRFAVASKFPAACLPAYASEFYKLTDDERERVVETALEAAGDSMAIVAQANHPSARVAAATAQRYVKLGAKVISFAVPRMFGLPTVDLLDYCRRICDAVDVPVLIQDFNPGGPTVGAEFAVQLAERSPNFRYLKLEESLMGPKIRDILEETGGRIGVLEGWGGMYMLDLIPAGICGLMPGLAVSDLLQEVWRLVHAGERDEAFAAFQIALPQILYSLQSSELFLWIEKRLLADRGIISHGSTHVRGATWTPDAATLEHGDWLNRQVVEWAEARGLPAG